jgi:hypothetical protein
VEFAAIGRSLEGTAFETRGPEIVRRDRFEAEVFGVPPSGLRPIRHANVHVVEPSHPEAGLSFLHVVSVEAGTRTGDRVAELEVDKLEVRRPASMRERAGVHARPPRPAPASSYDDCWSWSHCVSTVALRRAAASGPSASIRGPMSSRSNDPW